MDYLLVLLFMITKLVLYITSAISVGGKGDILIQIVHSKELDSALIQFSDILCSMYLIVALLTMAAASCRSIRFMMCSCGTCFVEK